MYGDFNNPYNFPDLKEILELYEAEKLFKKNQFMQYTGCLGTN